MLGLISVGLRGWGGVALLAAALALSACGSKTIHRAPVEDRNHSRGGDAAAKQFPGYENAGKPGYYTVKPGDTLGRLSFEQGQSYKDVARWNALDNPDKIEVGQVLRMLPPTGTSEPVGVAVARPVASTVVTSTPIAPGQNKPATATSAAPVAAAPVATAPMAPSAAAVGDDEVSWMWPANGNVIVGFDEAKNKGLDIGGAMGDAVVAAADGKVIWAAPGEKTMSQYGNLIIVQHNKTYLTAYANNSVLLVKEDQWIKKGQKIAEIGNSGTDRVKLHFQLRKFGKPLDPAKYMPAR